MFNSSSHAYCSAIVLSSFKNTLRVSSIDYDINVFRDFTAMQVSLHDIVSHQLFDWSLRKSKVLLVENFGEIVREISSCKEVDTSTSSPLFKAATKIYKLAKKKKNGLEEFVQNHVETLKSYEVKMEVMEGDKKEEEEMEEEEEVEKEEEMKDVEKQKVERGRRTDFNNSRRG